MHAHTHSHTHNYANVEIVINWLGHDRLSLTEYYHTIDMIDRRLISFIEDCQFSWKYKNILIYYQFIFLNT